MEKSIKLSKKDIIDDPVLMKDLFDTVPDSLTIIKKDFYFHVYIEYNSNSLLKVKNNFIFCKQEDAYSCIKQIWNKHTSLSYEIGNKVYFPYGDDCIKEFEILNFYEDFVILIDRSKKIYNFDKDFLLDCREYKDWMKRFIII